MSPRVVLALVTCLFAPAAAVGSGHSATQDQSVGTFEQTGSARDALGHERASRAPPDNVRGRESRRGMEPHDNRRGNALMMKELVRKIKSTGLKLDDWQAEGLATWAQAAVRKFAQGRSFEDILNFPANRVAAYLSDLSDEDLQLLNEDLGGKMAESIREKIKEAAARSPRTTFGDVLQQVAGDGGDGVASEAI